MQVLKDFSNQFLPQMKRQSQEDLNLWIKFIQNVQIHLLLQEMKILLIN